MKIIPILILSIFLQGCAFLDFFRKPDIPAVSPQKVVKLDPDVYKTCDLLKEDLAIATFEDSLIAYSDLATLYGKCANKQKDSVKLLKDFSNYKEPTK